MIVCYYSVYVLAHVVPVYLVVGEGHLNPQKSHSDNLVTGITKKKICHLLDHPGVYNIDNYARMHL